MDITSTSQKWTSLSQSHHNDRGSGGSVFLRLLSPHLPPQMRTGSASHNFQTRQLCGTLCVQPRQSLSLVPLPFRQEDGDCYADHV
jgi:hypothetical protein